MGSGVHSTTCSNGWACNHINTWMLLLRPNGEQWWGGEEMDAATNAWLCLKLGMLEKVHHSKERVLISSFITEASITSFGCQATAFSHSACMATGAKDLQKAAEASGRAYTLSRFVLPLPLITARCWHQKDSCPCYGQTLASSSSQAWQGFRSTNTIPINIVLTHKLADRQCHG